MRDQNHEQDDEYFNSLMSRVDHAIAGDVVEKPPLHKQLLSEHSISGLFCSAKYDHLPKKKRIYLLLFSFAAHGLVTGTYNACLLGGEPITSYDFGGAYCIVSLLVQTSYWIARTALRRPDKTCEDWTCFAYSFMFFMFFGWFITWSLSCIGTGIICSSMLHLFLLVLGTNWIIEYLLILLFLKMESRILTTVDHDSDYLKETGIEGVYDGYNEFYVPPTTDPPTSSMPTTVDL
jgi:hypothetical protein